MMKIEGLERSRPVFVLPVVGVKKGKKKEISQ